MKAKAPNLEVLQMSQFSVPHMMLERRGGDV